MSVAVYSIKSFDLMNTVNYQKELDKIIEKIVESRNEEAVWRHPALLLHSCCAPCSSYCMEYLREYFDITVFYYNPNISSEPEYTRRMEEEIRLIGEYNKQVDMYDKLRKEGTCNSSGSKKPGDNGIKQGCA